MVLPGHLAGGYLATQIVLVVGQPVFSSWQIGALTIIGILAGELPDIDLIRFHFDEKKNGRSRVRSHREYFTHGPLFWIILSLIVAGGGYLFAGTFGAYIGWILLAGTMSHMVLDSIDDGVMWLWPFSRKRYGVFKGLEVLADGPHSISYYWKFVTREYPKYWTFYAEILTTVIAVLVVAR